MFSSLFGHKHKPLSPEFLIEANRRNRFTPDIGLLERHPFQMVFVYDELRRDGHQYKDLLSEHSAYAGTAFTKWNYTLLRQELGEASRGIMLDANYTYPKARKVKGEVLFVESKRISWLDTYKENGIQFLRQKIVVLVPYYDQVRLPSLQEGGRHKSEYEAVFGQGRVNVKVPKMQEHHVWAYMAIPEYWDPLLDNGYIYRAVDLFQAHNKTINIYQDFNPSEHAKRFVKRSL